MRSIDTDYCWCMAKAPYQYGLNKVDNVTTVAGDWTWSVVEKSHDASLLMSLMIVASRNSYMIVVFKAVLIES